MRAGIPFRSVSGYLEDERAWARIGRWVRAAGVRAALRGGRHGLMGHLYPGMLDVSTDLTLVPANLGGHVEVLEFDDLRVRVEKVDRRGGRRTSIALAREVFELADSVDDDDFAWAARVSVGLDRLVDDFDLDSLAYYHRGLDGEIHERLGAGHDPRLLAAHRPRHPAGGRVRAAHLAGHADHGPARRRRLLHRVAGARLPRRRTSRWATTARPTWRSARAGRCCAASASTTASAAGACRSSSTSRTARSPLLGLGRSATGATRFVASEGEVVDGPLLAIGNTTSRVDFGCDPGEWTDAWSATGVAHHWALGTGHRAAELRALADLLGIDLVEVNPANQSAM